MATLTQIRDAVKTTLEQALPALTVYPTVPGATNLPAVVIEPVSAEYVTMGRGVDQWEFSLYVLCSLGEPDIGQRQLDTFITGAGDASIRQAIFFNRTLGLAGTDAHITSLDSYGGRFESASVEHVGAILHLTVTTGGTS